MNLTFNRTLITYLYRYGFIGCLLILPPLLLFANTRDQLGDVNNDGEVNVIDIVLVVDIILTEGIEYGDYELWASNVNEDEITDISDIVIMVDWILNPPEIIECPEYYSTCLDDTTECCPIITSHEFSWEIDTMGTYWSVLYGVQIVDENNIWAVGQVRLPDSTSATGYTNFGAAHWDGEEWELIKLSIGLGSLQPYDIYYESDESIWFVQGSVMYFNGDTISIEWLLPNNSLGLYEVWGNSPDLLYFVGAGGNVVKYDGVNYVPQNIGTNIFLRDLHGTPDDEYVFVVGWNDSGESTVWEYHNYAWNEIYYAEHLLPDDDDYGRVFAVHVVSDTAYITTKIGLWKYNFITTESEFMYENQLNMDGMSWRAIGSNTENDIMMFGYKFAFIHFNGEGWNYDDEFYQLYGDMNPNSYGGDIKGDIAVSVGGCCGGQYAIIARGYRR